MWALRRAMEAEGFRSNLDVADKILAQIEILKAEIAMHAMHAMVLRKDNLTYLCPIALKSHFVTSQARVRCRERRE
jgi:hypothetical protein